MHANYDNQCLCIHGLNIKSALNYSSNVCVNFFCLAVHKGRGVHALPVRPVQSSVGGGT